MKIENYILIATDGTQYLFKNKGETFLSGLIYDRDKKPYRMGGFIAPVEESVISELAKNLEENISEDITIHDAMKGEAVMKMFFEAGYIVKKHSYVNYCEQMCVIGGEGKPVVHPYCNWGGVDRNPRSPEEVIRGAVHLLYR